MSGDSIGDELARLEWKHDGDGWSLSVCGACPVQGEGYADGLPVYFRARGERWAFRVAATPGGNPVVAGWREPGWMAEGRYGEFPDAGWMRAEHSRAIVEACVRALRAARDAAEPGAFVEPGLLVLSEAVPTGLLVLSEAVPTGPDDTTGAAREEG